jgi:hypothetical protein
MTTATDLLHLSGTDLDDLFRASPAGPLPSGMGAGTAVVAAGTVAARPLAATTRLLAWQGKDFAPDGGSLRNLLTPFGVHAVEAKVYEDDSWFDGRPCVVLDYSATSKTARWVRDEIRQVAPGLYLGLVYVRSRRLPVRFTLQFAAAEGASQGAAEREAASPVR